MLRPRPPAFTLTTLSSTCPVGLLKLGSFALRVRAQPFLRLRLQHDEGVQHGGEVPQRQVAEVTVPCLSVEDKRHLAPFLEACGTPFVKEVKAEVSASLFDKFYMKP